MIDSTNPNLTASADHPSAMLPEGGPATSPRDPLRALMADHADGTLTFGDLLSRMAEMHAQFIERGEL